MTKPFKDQLKAFNVSSHYTIFLGVGEKNLDFLYENDRHFSILHPKTSKCQVSHDVFPGQLKLSNEIHLKQ